MAGTSSRQQASALRPLEFVRWLWTQLTAMRTALVLLFLVALAAIPGGLIPQTPVSAVRADDFAARHPWLDKVYRPLGFYDVYSSPWFSAIYLLLFVSLVGCIIPRIRVYLRAVRRPPPKVPARLDRLPEWAAFTSSQPATTLQQRAVDHLKQGRYRVRTSPAGVSAERGYLRELGNLVFHTSLVVALVAVAYNNLFSFTGKTVVVEGQGFSNSITQYDEFHAGAMVDTNRLEPFTLKLDQFQAKFETGPVQHGAARLFEAHVRAEASGRTWDQVIQVNQPLQVGPDKVHLLGHGYAAKVTVRDAQGNVALSGPVVFLPQDGNFSSAGVIDAPDARPSRLGFQGFFLPTATVDARGPHSVFPDAFNPMLFLTAWSGPPRVETGRPHNIYVLDTSGMKQFTAADGKGPLSFALAPGQTQKLPDGSSITFDSWSRWTQLQVSRAPGLPIFFGALGIGVIGLCLSLFIRPRRLFVRLTQSDDGTDVVVGGLDRAESRTGLADEVLSLVGALRGGGDPERPPGAESAGAEPEPGAGPTAQEDA